VFERESDVHRLQVGGGIHLWTNAMRALQGLGLAERIPDIGARIDRSEFVNWRGKLLATWPVGEIAAGYGLNDHGISRAELQQLLVEHQDVPVRTGMTCTGVEQDAEGVTASFADGSEERGAALVAADGLRSTIRQQLLGPQPPRYDGYTQCQSIVDGVEQYIPGDVERVIFGCRNRAVLHPVSGGRMFWTAAMYGPRDTLLNAPRKQTLLDHFQGWGPVEAAIDATDEAAIWIGDIYDRAPVERWGDGRVTLLGDAAHPLTTNLGQGANQALEDAAVLSTCLRAQPDLPAAFREYERRRIARTSAVVKRSHTIARAGALRPAFVCAIRDRILGVALRGPGLKGHRDLAAEPL
jgi:2-polyprenyl-6-methoxyphenol hydroxylase-like FAD-dependent oxidoreductase